MFTNRNSSDLNQHQAMYSPAEVSALVASVLRGESPEFTGLDDAGADQRLVDVAAREGVDCLLRSKLLVSGKWADISPALRTALDHCAKCESVLEMSRHRELNQVVAALSKIEVRVLVLKGAALGYTHYPEPYLRPCSDIDLLIERSSLDAAAVELQRLGYVRRNSVCREAVHTQWTFERHSGSFKHLVDLHWAVSNRPLFRDMFSFDELARDAVPVRQLGQGARTLSPVHALLFACMHRVAHHNGSLLLIWLYDLKLIAGKLSSDQWVLFWREALRKRMISVCMESLAAARNLLGASWQPPEAVLGSDATEHPHVEREPSAAYLAGAGTGLRSLRLDLEATRGTVAKLRLLGGHAFPAPDYMREAYGVTSRLALTKAYVQRAAAGAWRAVTSQVGSG